MHGAEALLRLGVTLCGGTPEPFNGLRIILRNPLIACERPAQLPLRKRGRV